MERTRILPASLAIALGVGLCASFGPIGTARAAACPPAAVVEGAPEIVTPIAAVLRRRGVRSEPSACGRVVRASLAARPDLGTYSLHIEDGYGRVSDREISDAGTAASLIESWLIDEDADVLAPRAAAVVPLPAESVTAAPPPAAPAAPAFSLATRAEVATASDGSIWYGGGLAACGRVGPICLGGRGGFARDASGGSGDFAGYLSRSRIGGGARAALPLSRGAFTFAPLVGVGFHWTRSVLNRLPFEMSADDLSVGVEGGIDVAGAISEHWSLVADLGGLLAIPVSRRAGGSPSELLPTAEILPAPPRGFLHVGIGLRFAR